MNHDAYTNEYIAGILRETKTVAVVGASANEVRPSFFVTRYMIDKGYDVYPINPGHAGKEIAGRLTYAHLADVPVAIDMVDVFRGSAFIPALVPQILALNPLPKVVWTQLTVRHDAAAAELEAAGIKVVMNRCPKIEYARLSGEIGWNGVASGVISSKKPLLHGSGFQSFGIPKR
jgi:predicted CoA-binding protein